MRVYSEMLLRFIFHLSIYDFLFFFILFGSIPSRLFWLPQNVCEPNMRRKSTTNIQTFI